MNDERMTITPEPRIKVLYLGRYWGTAGRYEIEDCTDGVSVIYKDFEAAAELCIPDAFEMSFNTTNGWVIISYGNKEGKGDEWDDTLMLLEEVIEYDRELTDVEELEHEIRGGRIIRTYLSVPHLLQGTG